MPGSPGDLKAAGKGVAESDTENSNDILRNDLPIHDWYRFVLSFPPHLVRRYLNAFGLRADQSVLDPFCGTGTTLVECRKQGISSLGIEPHPLARLASRVKTNWSLDLEALRDVRSKIVRSAKREQTALGLESSSVLDGMIREASALFGGLTEDQIKLIPEGFVSLRPLHRLLVLRNAIAGKSQGLPAEVGEFFQLALCHVIVNGAGNFAFGPEIYRTKPKGDYDVLGHFVLHTDRMLSDLHSRQDAGKEFPSCHVMAGDARTLDGVEPNSVCCVITSPPYPNEKDYTRITRVESVLLGLIANKQELRSVKESLLRSNTRNVFVRDNDGEWVKDVSSITRICQAIERRRKELGKTSGFERLYHRVVAHYFGGMARHFEVLRSRMKPGGRCAYVVGDQLSFLLVPIPTAPILSEVAARHGFKTVGCDLWRTRLGTKSGTRVREEVLLLERI